MTQSLTIAHRRDHRLCAAPASIWALTLLSASLLATGLAGCARDSDDETPEQATQSAAEAVRTDLYVVRGEVRRVPNPSDPAAEFVVRHEAIPHYRASGGKLGMNTMAMPFPVAAGLSLDEVKVGDKVEVTFEVEYNVEQDRPIAYRATLVQKLPDDTQLDFTPLPKPTAPGE